MEEEQTNGVMNQAAEDFMSRAAHHNQLLKKIDDLESLAFLLVFFLRGSLPWENQPQHEKPLLKERFLA